MHIGLFVFQRIANMSEGTHDLAAHNPVDCQNCQCFAGVVVLLVFSFSCILYFHRCVVVVMLAVMLFARVGLLPRLSVALYPLYKSFQNLRLENKMAKSVGLKVFITFSICFIFSL